MKGRPDRFCMNVMWVGLGVCLVGAGIQLYEAGIRRGKNEERNKNR